MRTTLAFRYILYFVTYIPALALIAGSLGLPFGAALSLAVSVTAWRVLSEYAHLKLFEKTGIVLIRRNAPVWLTIAVCAALAYAPFFFEGMPTAGHVLLYWPVAALVAIAGLAAAVGLAKYPDYRAAVEAATKRDDPLLDFGKLMADAQKNTVKVKDSDYAVAGEQVSAQVAGKEGYDYLHALFFARHRSLIRQPFKKRLAIIAGLGAAGAALVLFGSSALSSAIVEHAGNVVRYMVIAMFMLTLGEQMCRSLFYHCDIHLLRYSFFRKDAGVHFRYRLKRLMRYNLAIGAALAAAITLVLVLAGGVPGGAGAAGAVAVGIFVRIWLLAGLLAVFFAVHHLALYYLFQPYSTELNAKNPLYHVINSIVSGFCGASIFLPITPVPLTWTIGVLTVLYAAAAFILVGKHGPRTFRVK